MQRKGHIYVVDICRFLAILMIMAHHRYIMGFEGNYIFLSGWAWVEYFFMLTGYLTMAHFEHQGMEEHKYGQEAFLYTLRKFRTFICYVIIAAIVQYAVEGFHFIREGNFDSFIKSFINIPFEIGMLSSAGFTGARVAPLWFLSVMFLTLPLLICLMLRWRDIWMVISFLIPVLYYGKMGMNTERIWPNDILRGFAAMSLGMFIFFVTGYIQKKEWSRIQRILLTAVEIGAFLLAVYITAFNKEYLNWLLILFSLNLCIMMSGCSFTSGIKGDLCVFLGKISLPIFIFHWPIGTIALHFSGNLSVKLIIYYVATIIVSCIAVIVTDWIKKRTKRKQIGV